MPDHRDSSFRSIYFFEKQPLAKQVICRGGLSGSQWNLREAKAAKSWRCILARGTMVALQTDGGRAKDAERTGLADRVPKGKSAQEVLL